MFYIVVDGGMVFVCFNEGVKIFSNIKYVCIELWEMLRCGNIGMKI